MRSKKEKSSRVCKGVSGTTRWPGFSAPIKDNTKNVLAGDKERGESNPFIRKEGSGIHEIRDFEGLFVFAT